MAAAATGPAGRGGARTLAEAETAPTSAATAAVTAPSAAGRGDGEGSGEWEALPVDVAAQAPRAGAGAGAGPRLVFQITRSSVPSTVRKVLVAMGWEERPEDTLDDEYNLWWKSSRFRKETVARCAPWQRLNHFPSTNAMSKKDCLTRLMRKMQGIYGSAYRFVPFGFILPLDASKFAAEYSTQRDKDDTTVWICKPADAAQGRGIFLFRDIKDLRYDQACIVQQYLHRPLMIGGYKLDIRLYVCVTSYHPLTAYMYRDGLARFGTEKYDLTDIGNPYSHLTNTSINKHSATCSANKEGVGAGCKWTLGQLRAYFAENGIDDRRLWRRVTSLVILTLLAQAEEVPRTRNCFELYGFDVLIDEKLKPWLLEVNLSPSLALDCAQDHEVKIPLIQDTIRILGFDTDDRYRGLPPPSKPLRRPSSGTGKKAKRRGSSAGRRPSSGTAAPKARTALARPATSSDSSSRLGHQRAAAPPALDALVPPGTGDYVRIFPYSLEVHDAAGGRRIDFKTILPSMRAQMAIGRKPKAGPKRAASAKGRAKKARGAAPPAAADLLPPAPCLLSFVPLESRDKTKGVL